MWQIMVGTLGTSQDQPARFAAFLCVFVGVEGAELPIICQKP